MNPAIVLRAQAGDRDAYEQLAREVSQPLFLAASRILRDTDAAEDAVQLTLVAIWRDLRSLRDPERFSAWAYRTLVRFCHLESRKHRRAGVTFIEIGEASMAADDGTDVVVARDELAGAFAALSLDHRTVVVLRHMAGLSLGEIAEILDIPYGTVGSRLHHAILAMRRVLDAPVGAAAREGRPA